MKTILVLTFFLISSHVFSQSEELSDTVYKAEIEQWHQRREKSLKSETGWLNIVGLHWLKEGENTIGCGKGNDVVLPSRKADERVGSLILKEGIVSLNAEPGVLIEVSGQSYAGGVIFDEKEETPVVVSHKKLKWFIIKRGTKYGVRLRDLESDALKNFTHIDYFQIDRKWKITATYDAPAEPKTVPVHDVIGLTTETPFGGTLHFEIDGKKYQLDATLEGNDLFIVFADPTNGNETYGGGRFLYAKKPVSGSEVILDFNKAYNPPCCFTDYATCPLPLPQNRLSVKVTAGEKSYGHH